MDLVPKSAAHQSVPMPTGPNNLFLMSVTDAGIFPFPIGNVSHNRFALELSHLGFSGMVAISEKHQNVQIPNFTVHSGQLINASAKEFQKQVSLAIRQRPDDLIIVRADENRQNRTALNTNGVLILSGIERTPKDGFDRFCAKLAADRGIAIDLCTFPLVHLTGTPRQKIIRRYHEILTLYHRFEFPLTISSGALTITDIRSSRAIDALLFESLGEDIAWESFATVEELLSRTGPVWEVL